MSQERKSGDVNIEELIQMLDQYVSDMKSIRRFVRHNKTELTQSTDFAEQVKGWQLLQKTLFNLVLKYNSSSEVSKWIDVNVDEMAKFNLLLDKLKKLAAYQAAAASQQEPAPIEKPMPIATPVDLNLHRKIIGRIKIQEQAEKLHSPIIKSDKRRHKEFGRFFTSTTTSVQETSGEEKPEEESSKKSNEKPHE
jgi:hypothetical protein